MWVNFRTTHSLKTELFKVSNFMYLIIFTRQYWCNKEGGHDMLLVSNIWYNYVTGGQTGLSSLV
jgi:hypothetical protein